MREVTQGMLDRYQRRFDSLGYATTEPPRLFGLGRRAQLKAIREAMGIFKRERKWDPELEQRYFTRPDGSREYHPKSYYRTTTPKNGDFR